MPLRSLNLLSFLWPIITISFGKRIAAPSTILAEKKKIKEQSSLIKRSDQKSNGSTLFNYRSFCTIPFLLVLYRSVPLSVPFVLVQYRSILYNAIFRSFDRSLPFLLVKGLPLLPPFRKKSRNGNQRFQYLSIIAPLEPDPFLLPFHSF